LENIYFTDIEKKTENGVDTLVKKETTNIIYRFNLLEYVERLNWSLEVSKLPYRVVIDSSVETLEKARETKDIFLEHTYLSSAIQEIYTQWEIPFYFEGNRIIVKDCSENISEVLEYGAENSLLSIKKNNANFRKITRISGYGSDKNIPFYYPNWSQKGVIDVKKLDSNIILDNSMITITDMKKFDKKMPLNGVVKYLVHSETHPIYNATTFNKDGLKYNNETSTQYTFILPFESVRENNSTVDIHFDVEVYEQITPTVKSQYLEYDFEQSVLADMLHSPIFFEPSYLKPISDDATTKGNRSSEKIECSCTVESSSISSTMGVGTENKGELYITTKKRICLIQMGLNVFLLSSKVMMPILL
jgi:hypothetical protein